ncbi:MAG: succinylglutamate desuccinylase/aspartoacylase family protein [Planctomycetes bacterium]|jgi:carboxypeptidase D|nr:succinylglutamate desuccinylase/aspartoacylase family protein [Planctomycetota bacterium]HPY75354.1 M14 family zinc carboxypeptidase [Planctomycetota bacterium]HQA99689.1 M14 family zinc carboxypeptidase [Planctomycetota bacterium]
MKKIIIACLFIFTCSIFAQSFDELNYAKERIAIPIQSRSDFENLVRIDVDVDYCTRELDTVYVYATQEEQNMLRELGYEFTLAPTEIGEDTERAMFHTHETLTTELQELEAQYPHIAKLYTIGKSVNGLDLWVMKISDNVEQDEPEPEVKYVSTMHGDEVVGQELGIYFIRQLLENYGKDAELTAMVNDLELWIMPNMNPDGTAAKRRYNAEWKDLNRKFPDPVNDATNDPTGRPHEVQLMMKFQNERNFRISLNYHGGAVVVNYPWDTQKGDIPDLALTKFLALGYSKRNLPMYNSTSFTNGITNGAAWYEIDGSMQDWNYNWYSCIDLTIEVSQRKWPSADTLEQYWTDNKDSMRWFFQQANRGIHGIVTDKATKKPIAANVDIVGINKPIVASKLHGDYQKILLAGTYTVKFTADGYKDLIVSNVQVKDATEPTILNVQMVAE